jgi:hypothetical protein
VTYVTQEQAMARLNSAIDQFMAWDTEFPIFESNSSLARKMMRIMEMKHTLFSS